MDLAIKTAEKNNTILIFSTLISMLLHMHHSHIPRTMQDFKHTPEFIFDELKNLRK